MIYFDFSGEENVDLNLKNVLLFVISSDQILPM